MEFEWDEEKDKRNQKKHGVSFSEAVNVFYDPKMFTMKDQKHSKKEDRYFCFGIVNDEVLTVRFTRRNKKIRIIGAGYWRAGRKAYDEKNKMGG